MLVNIKDKIGHVLLITVSQSHYFLHSRQQGFFSFLTEKNYNQQIVLDNSRYYTIAKYKQYRNSAIRTEVRERSQ